MVSKYIPSEVLYVKALLSEQLYKPIICGICSVALGQISGSKIIKFLIFL